jgi:hypothetical protein
MRDVFIEWYSPDEEELEAIWGTATFVLDANVLLDIYRYPAEAQEQVLAFLESLRDRLWLPHRVGYEYLRNREGIMPALQSALGDVRSRIEKAKEFLESLPVPEQHPVLDREALGAASNKVLAEIAAVMELIDEATEATAKLVADSNPDQDPIWFRLTAVFDGRTGAPWPAEEWADFVKTGRERLAAGTPPGYRDAKKNEPDCFGDLLIWRQLIRAAEARPEGSRATIFVTNDRKEDWWERRRGELRGPRRELIREYYDATQARLLMYTSAEFLAAARKILQAHVTGEAIAEVERVSAEASVVALLWSQRMTLPPAPIREKALNNVFEAVQRGAIRTAGELGPLTHQVAATSPVSSYVETPFFFSLVNRAYGPLIAEEDPSRPLRERSIRFRESCESRSEFLERGHAAWLAQAMFRIWHQDVSDDAILTAFFEDSDDWSRRILARAKRFVQQDHVVRAGEGSPVSERGYVLQAEPGHFEVKVSDGVRLGG